MTDNVIYPFKQREDFLKDVVKEPVQLRKKTQLHSRGIKLSARRC